MDERRIVMYMDITETPPDLEVGEVLPVIRGGGPRDGELIGMATVISTDDGVGIHVEPSDDHAG